MTWIAKDLSWIKSYFDLAKTVLPKVSKITHIRKTVPKKDHISRQLGCLTYNPNKKVYSMTLYTKYRRVDKIRPQVKCQLKTLSKIDILETFAHELAHLTHWDHTPQHKILECKLKLMFMVKLHDSGYISEEEELK